MAGFPLIFPIELRKTEIPRHAITMISVLEIACLPNSQVSFFFLCWGLFFKNGESYEEYIIRAENHVFNDKTITPIYWTIEHPSQITILLARKHRFAFVLWNGPIFMFSTRWSQAFAIPIFRIRFTVILVFFGIFLLVSWRVAMSHVSIIVSSCFCSSKQRLERINLTRNTIFRAGIYVFNDKTPWKRFLRIKHLWFIGQLTIYLASKYLLTFVLSKRWILQTSGLKIAWNLCFQQDCHKPSRFDLCSFKGTILLASWRFACWYDIFWHFFVKSVNDTRNTFFRAEIHVSTTRQSLLILRGSFHVANKCIEWMMTVDLVQRGLVS